MKVVVDAEVCTGHGRCYVLAPDVFGTDDYGHCVVLHDDVDDGSDLAAQARIGVENCPERAITVD